MKEIIKKIIIAITIIPTIVLIVIKSICIKSSAAMIIPSVLGGFTAIIAGLLVAAGVSVNTDSGTYTGQAIYDLPPATIEQAFAEYCLSEKGQSDIKNGFIDSSSAAVDLSNWINENIIKTSGGSGNNFKDPAADLLLSAGALEVAKTLVDWIKDHQDSVKTETVSGDYPIIEGAKSILYFYGNNAYTAYYSKEPGRIYSRTSTSFSYSINHFCVVSKSSNGTSETNYYDNSTGGTFYFNNPAKVRFIGEWIDISNNTELEISEDIAGEEQSLPIGSVDIEGVEYPVTPEGVQIGDNVYPISNDGTITIEGNTYKPTYYINNFDDSAIIDLLLELSKKIDTLSLPADDESVDDIVNNAVISIPEDLTKLNLKPGIASVFPFCIPFDFVRGLKLLAVQPEAPRFEVPFVLPEFGSFPGVDEKIVVDFADYTSYFDVVRWGNYVIFLFGLCFITFKLVKGA